MIIILVVASGYAILIQSNVRTIAFDIWDSAYKTDPDSIVRLEHAVSPLLFLTNSTGVVDILLCLIGPFLAIALPIRSLNSKLLVEIH